jgi:hypothetical protein
MLAFEDIEAGVIYEGASGQQKKVLKMWGVGWSRMVQYEVINFVGGRGLPKGTIRTRHIGEFKHWSVKIVNKG